MVFPAGGVSDFCSHSQSTHHPTFLVASKTTPSSTKVFQRQSTPPPHLSQCIFLRLVLVLATKDPGTYGLLQSNLTHVPQSCWDPDFLCSLSLPPWYSGPISQVLKAWHSPGGSISLCSCSSHLYIWAINLWRYYTLCTSVIFFLCKFGMCSQFHSGQMGVGWGKMETRARKREALLLDWYLWEWELGWGRLEGNSQNKVTGVGAVMSWRSHCDTYPHTRRGARIGQEGIEGNERHLPSYQTRNS